MMDLSDDAVGYACCFIAVVFFGSNYVPVKSVPVVGPPRVASGVQYTSLKTCCIVHTDLLATLAGSNSPALSLGRCCSSRLQSLW